MLELSEAAENVLQFISRTSSPIFLTGKAGTGKTTLLREIIRTTYKNAVVVAPTGIAALNAGGVTIHSMFGLPLASFVPDSGFLPQLPNCNFENTQTLKRHFRLSQQKRAVVRAMELLIIDEVSMLRPDLLDALELMLRHVRRTRQPFGGVQVLFIGDLFQLPPVIKNEEWSHLSRYYSGKYFFNAQVLEANPPVYIELSKIFRQDDQDFIDILNELRHNTLSNSSLSILNSHVRPGYDPSRHDGRIILTTHNNKADAINERSLDALPGPMHVFRAEVHGDFPERMFPIEQDLRLREGSRVMFIKNDLANEKRFFNGKTGTVEYVDTEDITVRFDDGTTIDVPRYEWQNIRYNLNETREITEEVLGTFVQYPLRLAWAITVHKSQGLTFDKAALDVSQVFMPGQAYVALSRLRSLGGLILMAPMRLHGIGNDESVAAFSERSSQPVHDRLNLESARFFEQQVSAGFDFDEVIQTWEEALAKPSKAETKKILKSHSDVLYQLAATGRNFQSRVRGHFNPVDTRAIVERTKAATEYFVPRLTELLAIVRHERDALRQMPKTKQIAANLDALDEALNTLMLSMLRSERVSQVFADGEIPSKQNLGAAAIAAIYSERVGEIRPKRAAKEPKHKKNTYLQTLELWQDGQSIPEIAALRKLSEKTVYGHMAQLVQIKAVNPAELIPAHKLEKLREMFSADQDYTLTQMKNAAGESFSYEDLKIFRASLTNALQEQPE